MPRALTSQKIPPLTDTRSLGQRPWMADIACANMTSAQIERTFFPTAPKGRGHRRTDAIWDDARIVCEGCSVRAACLADVMEDEADTGAARYGYRGGKTPDERYALAGEGKQAPRTPTRRAKVCTSCHVSKDLDAFEHRRAQCRDCRRFHNAQRQVEYRAKHGRPDRVDPAEREKHRARQAKARAAKRAAKAA